ncbi:MAG TPA: hypothetical protein VHO95_02660, partial [Candidatus Dormibacteraeota bacterium]|nr:hypothetical protein [Candidatus Dormibacteraeota bacterium]
QEALRQLVGRYVQERVALKLEGAGRALASGARPARLTEEGARAERLESLRSQDPGLNAAVDALDLELLE